MAAKHKNEGSLYKRLKTQYRIVFINDGTLEEVASFKLTIRKLYVLFSTLFVVIVGLTIALLLLTPLKYYIPGYGSNKTHMQVIKLGQTVDSLTDLVGQQQLYEANLRKVINGGYEIKKDTVVLNPKEAEKAAINNMYPVQDIKKNK